MSTDSFSSGSGIAYVFCHNIVQRNLDCLDIPWTPILASYIDDLTLTRQDKREGSGSGPCHLQHRTTCTWTHSS